MLKRWLKWSGAGLLALLLTVLVLISLILKTEWGARFALNRAAGFVPGSLTVAEVNGSLEGPLKLRGIRYRHDGLHIDARRLHLDLDLSSLVGGTVQIEALSLQHATVRLPPPGPEPAPEPEAEQPFRLPEIHLPVAVAVENVHLTDVRVVPYEGEPIVIHSLDLNAAFAGGALHIDRLELDTSLGYAKLKASVDTVAAYQTDLDLRFGWRQKETLIEGQFAVQGNLDHMRIRSQVGPPVRLQLDAQMEDVMEDLNFVADVQLAGFEAVQFGVEALPGPVRAELELEGGLEHITLEGAIASGERRVVIEALEVGLQADRIVLETLQIRGRGATRLIAGGQVGLGGEQPVVDLEAQWTALAIPLAPNQMLESPSGQIDIQGTLDDYRVTAQARVGGAVPAGQWHLQGHGSLKAFTLEQLQAQTLEGTIQAAGRVTWDPKVEWRLDLSARQINPAALAPPWPGQLDLALQTSGTLTDAGPEARLQLQQLSGTLRHRPVEATADIRMVGLQNIQGEVYLSSADSEITASGLYGAQSDVTVDLAIPQLRDLYPEAAGALHGTLHLTGTMGDLRLRGDLHGGQLRFAGNQVGALNTRFDLAQAEAAHSELTLDAQAIQAAGVTVSALDLEVAGTRAQHQLDLSAMGPAGEVALGLEGGWTGQAWQGTIDTLRLANERAGEWRLRQPAPVQASATAASLQQFCLASTQGEVCAAGRWSQQRGVTADLTLDQLPLAAADALVSQALKLPATFDGSLNGEAHIDMAPGRAPAVELHLQTRGAALNIEQTGTIHTLTFSPFRLDATLDQRELDAGLELVIEELGRVTASLRSPSLNMDTPAASPLSGELKVDIRTLAPVAPLIGPLAKTDGKIQGRVALDGTLNRVELSGEVQVSDFTTHVPAAGLELTDGRLSLNAAGQRLTFDGQVTSGGGQLKLAGEALFPSSAPVQVTAQVEGERFLAADIPGVEVFVSPALDASIAGKRIEVTGKVEIPQATIKTGEIEGGGPSAVSVSPDVVVVGVEQEPGELPVRLYAEIDVILGEDVEIHAPGFEGAADGRLHVSVVPGEPALGSGQLFVSGTYQAYGQDLTIREGQVLYSDSPLDNPGLAITAVRVVDDVTAGVRITGTVKDPSLELFSEPPLGSDAEILSYIVLGKPLEQASGGEGLDLRRKATIKGAGLLASKIGARLGLEDVSVEETETGVSVLRIGQYLSPRLYISYGMGILEPVTVIQLEYFLTDIWTLEASSGVETRAGIRFEYEPE